MDEKTNDFATLLKKYTKRTEVGADRLATLICKKFGHIPDLKEEDKKRIADAITNWLHKGIKHPQKSQWKILVAIAAVVSLSENDLNEFLKAAGQESWMTLRDQAEDKDKELFTPWTVTVSAKIVEAHLQNSGKNSQLLAEIHESVVVTEETMPRRDKYQSQSRVVSIQSQTLPLQRRSRASFFVNRETERSQLLNDLEPGRVITVCGPGGIGKTALVAEVLWELAPREKPPTRFPDGILFYSFYEQPNITLALDHIARSLGEEPLPTVEQAAQRALGKKCVLLVLDGAEEASNLKILLGMCGRSSMLITSRRRDNAINSHYRLDLKQLTSNESIRLMRLWGGKRSTDSAAVSQICEYVDNLPLALRIAGCYLAQQEQEASEYLSWLQSAPLSALEQGKSQQDSIHVLLDRTMDKLSGQARKVLIAISCLGMAPFDRTLIAQIVAFSNEEVGQALGELVNYSLVDRKDLLYTVSHRLIHIYAQRELLEREEPSVQCGFAGQVVQAFVALLPDISLAFMFLPKQYVHLAFSIVTLIERYSLISPSAAQLLVRVGGYMIEGAQFEQAETLLERAREISERTNDHLSQIIALDCLGLLMQNQGRLISDAESFYEDARKIGEQELSTDHPYLGTVLDHLAQMYHDYGLFNEAESLYLKALAIKEKSLGPEHMRTGATISNLALLYAAQKDYTQAQTFGLRALKICEKQEPASPATATVLQNLASFSWAQDDLTQAHELSQRALQICEEALGSDNYSTAHALYQLACLYSAQGENDQAKPLCQRALKIFEDVFESHHYLIIETSKLLAEICETLGEGEQVQQLRQSIRQREWSRHRQSVPFGWDICY